VSNLRRVLVAVAVTVVAATVGTIMWVAPHQRGARAAPGTRLFTGDYSTGNFSQWRYVQNHDYNGDAAGYTNWGYPASIITEPGRGYVARYELRSGDLMGPTERSEVEGDDASGGAEGQIRWYRFSTKFDATFPQNHASLGFGLTNQWHGRGRGTPPPILWVVNALDGNWSLRIAKQSSPNVYLEQFSIFDVPLGTEWHDVTMQISWSVSDATGWVRLWHNGVRQTFIGGGDTFFVRTLVPGDPTVYYKEGYYRSPLAPTGIVYHTGFRCADSEDAL
jgi:Polysaccharide lyase